MYSTLFPTPFCFWEAKKGYWWISMNRKECSVVQIILQGVTWCKLYRLDLSRKEDGRMRNEERACICCGQRSVQNGPKKSGPSLWLDIILTIGGYCSVSLSHWNGLDRMNMLFVAWTETSPDNLHTGLWKKKSEKWLYFLGLWLCSRLKGLEL